MSRRAVVLTDPQREAITAIKDIARSGATPLCRVENLGTRADMPMLRLHLRTDEITVEARGLPIRNIEQVVVGVPRAFPWLPPMAQVEHRRFAGYPHVLAGAVLCLFLDPAQEWHPSLGVIGFLNRLWTWLHDAAADKFEPERALFHPVGGVWSRTPGTPTVVVRCPLAGNGPGLRAMALRSRTVQRLDLIPLADAARNDTRILVVGLHRPLVYGPGLTLDALLDRVRQFDGLDAGAVLQALGCTARRNPSSSALHFLLSVPPDPRERGVLSHLVAARLPPPVATALADAARSHGLLDPDEKIRPWLDTAIEWCPVSEERIAMTTRRDSTRPLAALLNARVVLWGCGGLGSWIAEYLARAGIREITLADPGAVTGGLLVRQNYTEQDIGANKADALARHLRALRDDLSVIVADACETLTDEGSLPECDLLVDATINIGVAAALTAVWRTSRSAPVVARVATDRATGTLGLITVTQPSDGRPNPEDIERAIERRVDGDPHLEVYRCFWDPPTPADELLAEPGCSVPTFHGSAADLAALAGTMLNIIAPHLNTPALAGAHLLAMPHSPLTSAGSRWYPHPGATTAGHSPAAAN